jgi:hypothetical protein
VNPVCLYTFNPVRVSILGLNRVIGKGKLVLFEDPKYEREFNLANSWSVEKSLKGGRERGARIQMI